MFKSGVQLMAEPYKTLITRNNQKEYLVKQLLAHSVIHLLCLVRCHSSTAYMLPVGLQKPRPCVLSTVTSCLSTWTDRKVSFFSGINKSK